MALKVVDNRVETARLGDCEAGQVQRNIKLRHPRFPMIYQSGKTANHRLRFEGAPLFDGEPEVSG